MNEKTKTRLYLLDTVFLQPSNLKRIFYIIYVNTVHAASYNNSHVAAEVMMQKLWYHSCRLLAKIFPPWLHMPRAAPKVSEFTAACPEHYKSTAV